MGTSNWSQVIKGPTNIEESGEIIDDDGVIEGYVEESATEEGRYKQNIRIEEEQKEDKEKHVTDPDES